MDAAAALERLRDISAQVRAVVIFERGGKVVGSTLPDDQRAAEIAREAEQLLAEAERHRDTAEADAEFAQLEVALQGGSVFVVGDGKRLIAATTPPEPTVGLVFYDLKSCLRELESPAEPKKRAPAASAARPRKRTGGGETGAERSGGSPDEKQASAQKSTKRPTKPGKKRTDAKP